MYSLCILSPVTHEPRIPPSDDPSAAPQHGAGALCAVPDCPTCAHVATWPLSAEESERYRQLWELLMEWCGVAGVTKPDEVHLATHILNGGGRDPVLLDAISARWDSILTKWDAKGWWTWGVSMRTGWFTDKGKVAIERRLEETKRRMSMSGEYETELHSTDPSAVQATRATIEMLGGKLVERDGKFFLAGGDKPAHFIQWAAVRQGYVRGAKPVEV